MNPALILAAIEINQLWLSCLDKDMPVNCPSNEEIAEIIERHLGEIIERHMKTIEQEEDFNG